jgi:hydroxymethylpyrimidine/phosphomethylpyrimidine kinase
MQATTLALHSSPPVVLCLSGHDPTGGAGIQADIEAVRAMGAHPATLITALTAQDSENVIGLYPQDPEALMAQGLLLLRDLNVAVIKIGLLGSQSIALKVAELIDAAGPVPVVLDPVLAAGGGADLAGDRLLSVIRHEILPKVTWVTPNVPEARRLAGRTLLEECAERLMTWGVRHVMVTGTHDEGASVINRWYGPQGVTEWGWPRLPHEYHGSGCTLAAALAAAIACGQGDAEAAYVAQSLTYGALKAAYPLGRGQWFPARYGVSMDLRKGDDRGEC